MSRRDYQIVAEAIALLKDRAEAYWMALRLAAEFGALNPRFNDSRWYAACNVPRPCPYCASRKPEPECDCPKP